MPRFLVCFWVPSNDKTQNVEKHCKVFSVDENLRELKNKQDVEMLLRRKYKISGYVQNDDVVDTIPGIKYIRKLAEIEEIDEQI